MNTAYRTAKSDEVERLQGKITELERELAREKSKDATWTNDQRENAKGFAEIVSGIIAFVGWVVGIVLLANRAWVIGALVTSIGVISNAVFLKLLTGHWAWWRGLLGK